MKMLLPGLVVLGVAACIHFLLALSAEVVAFVFTHQVLHGKSIDVVLYDGTSRTDHRLPALDGGAAGYSSGYGLSMPGVQTHVQIDETYHVASDQQGHFRVAMHRVVDRNGVKTTTDRSLPVWNDEPALTKRIKLEDGSAAVAYFATESSH